YKRFFGRLSPSKITRSALADEIREVKRMIGEFEAMPADDALRVAHYEPVRTNLANLEVAVKAEGDADVALSVARSRLAMFKARIDKQRLDVYASLLKILNDKDAANSYFRPTTAAPEGGDT